MLLILIYNIFSFHKRRPAADYIFFLAFPSMTCFRWQFLSEMQQFQLAFLPSFHAGYSSSAVLYAVLRFHIIGPTDLLHPSSTFQKFPCIFDLLSEVQIVVYAEHYVKFFVYNLPKLLTT